MLNHDWNVANSSLLTVIPSHQRHLEPGLRSRSPDRSWSRPESTVLVGVGVGARVGKILPARSCSITPSRDGDFCGTVVHRLGNIESREEKDSGSVKIKLERHLVT